MFESVPPSQVAAAASTPPQLMLPLQPQRSQSTSAGGVGIGSPSPNCSGSINSPSVDAATAATALPEHLCRRSWNRVLMLKLQWQQRFLSIDAPTAATALPEHLRRRGWNRFLQLKLQWEQRFLSIIAPTAATALLEHLRSGCLNFKPIGILYRANQNRLLHSPTRSHCSHSAPRAARQ